MIKTLNLAVLRLDGDTQARLALSQEKVQEYAALMEDGEEFRPIDAFFDGSDYWLADGFHRYFATKANKWLGRNSTRYSNPEYDKAYLESQSEMDPVKRAALFIKMNDMPVNDVAIIPVVYRPRTAGAVNNLVAPLSGWDNDLWMLKDWFRNV